MVKGMNYRTDLLSAALDLVAIARKHPDKFGAVVVFGGFTYDPHGSRHDIYFQNRRIVTVEEGRTREYKVSLTGATPRREAMLIAAVTEMKKQFSA